MLNLRDTLYYKNKYKKSNKLEKDSLFPYIANTNTYKNFFYKYH